MRPTLHLGRADSLARCGIADSARTVRLLSDLHRDYTEVKENSRGKRVRLKAVSGTERFLWGALLTAVLLTAVSPASVSQQKFRLKKRLAQTDETLFNDGETVDIIIAGC